MALQTFENETISFPRVAGVESWINLQSWMISWTLEGFFFAESEAYVLEPNPAMM
jgi:hypothetical protein